MCVVTTTEPNTTCMRSRGLPTTRIRNPKEHACVVQRGVETNNAWVVALKQREAAAHGIFLECASNHSFALVLFRVLSYFPICPSQLWSAISLHRFLCTHTALGPIQHRSRGIIHVHPRGSCPDHPRLYSLSNSVIGSNTVLLSSC